MVVPWLAMAGRYDECETVLDRMRGMVRRTGMDEAQEAVDTAEIGLSLWSGHADVAADAISTMLDGPYPLSSTAATYRWRSGDEDAARAVLVEHPVVLEDESFLAPMDWANAACVALLTGDPALGQRVGDLLTPWAGLACSIGSGMASGPIDAYRAFAAAAAGDRGCHHAGGRGSRAVHGVGTAGLRAMGRGARSTYAF